MSLLHTVQICLYCIISMHFMQFDMHRRWYICTYAIRWRTIQGRMQWEKRKDEKQIEIQSFECISEWQYHTAEPYWSSHRHLLLYFRIATHLYLLFVYIVHIDTRCANSNRRINVLLVYTSAYIVRIDTRISCQYHLTI